MYRHNQKADAMREESPVSPQSAHANAPADAFDVGVEHYKVTRVGEWRFQ